MRATDGVAGRAADEGTQDEEGEQEAERETTDVGEEGDTSAHGCLADAGNAGEQVLQEPETNHERGGHGDGDEDEDEERDYDVHGGTRIEDQVGTEDRGDGPAGADVRDHAIGISEGLAEGGEHAPGQVEQQVSDVAQAVFDVVPEHPEEKHVADDVEPPRMHEERREN